MAGVISTNDGGIYTLFDFRDFADLVRERIGFDAERWLEEYLSETYGEEDEIAEIEDYYEKKQEHYKQVMAEIRAEAEKLAVLIREKDLDRKAISAAAGRIGCLTWREVNRP